MHKQIGRICFPTHTFARMMREDLDGLVDPRGRCVTAATTPAVEPAARQLPVPCMPVPADRACARLRRSQDARRTGPRTGKASHAEVAAWGLEAWMIRPVRGLNEMKGPLPEWNDRSCCGRIGCEASSFSNRRGVGNHSRLRAAHCKACRRRQRAW